MPKEGERRESGTAVQVETNEGTLDLIIRSLRTSQDYAQCEELERATWGEPYVVPSSLVMVTQKIGGVAAGAFDSEGQMVGTVFGLAGWYDGERVHWSHMAAVKAGLRGRGLGRELKLFQRRVVRSQGVSKMLWSYDPLVARNAQLNINRLGALPVEYLEDLYGPGSDSDLHRGLGTDRFVVAWSLDEEPAVAAEDPRAWNSVPSANTDGSGSPRQGDFELPEGDRARIEIPVDIQQAKEEVPEAGGRWRFCTRRAFQFYLSRGHRVVGFERDSAPGRCAYLLRQKETA